MLSPSQAAFAAYTEGAEAKIYAKQAIKNMVSNRLNFRGLLLPRGVLTRTSHITIGFYHFTEEKSIPMPPINKRKKYGKTLQEAVKYRIVWIVMKLKQISAFATIPCLILSAFVVSLVAPSPVNAAAETCENLYSTAPVASQEAKDKASELLKACNKGVDTGKCDTITKGKETTKAEKVAACNKGVAYRAENPPSDESGVSGEEAYVAANPVEGDDCGGVETAIIKCGATNSGDTKDNGIWALLLIALNILTAGVGIVAVGGIVYGSILYTTAEDKADQVKKAIDIITNVIIGLVLFALMYAGLNFIVPGGVFTA